MVEFAGIATHDEAEALAAALEERKYSHRHTSVRLTKTLKQCTYRFSVAENTRSLDDAVALYERIVTTVASATGGLPITMELVEAGSESPHTVTVAGDLPSDDERIHYDSNGIALRATGAVSLITARRFCDAFAGTRLPGYKAAWSIDLDRQLVFSGDWAAALSEPTILFHINEGEERRTDFVAAVKEASARAAACLGGLPVTLDLIDPTGKSVGMFSIR